MRAFVGSAQADRSSGFGFRAATAHEVGEAGRCGSVVIQRRLSYYNYLLSSEWKTLRRKVIIRAKGICERCGLANIEEIHHLTYKRFQRELLADLLGVCGNCHEKIHYIKNEHLIPLVFGGD